MGIEFARVDEDRRTAVEKHVIVVRVVNHAVTLESIADLGGTHLEYRDLRTILYVE